MDFENDINSANGSQDRMTDQTGLSHAETTITDSNQNDEVLNDQQPTALLAEQKRLRPINHPGRRESTLAADGKRERRPSSAAARMTYTRAFKEFRDMLDGLYRPDGTGLPKPVPLSRELDEEIKQREAKLIHPVP